MRLRRPCEHDRYEKHAIKSGNIDLRQFCPGGEFLPEDAFDKIKAEGIEMRCQRCPNRNVKSWFVVSEIWNVVQPDGSGILCPQCFTELHAEATGDWQTWELRAADQVGESG